ncbi:MAG: hypothetical protein ACOX2K_00375 [Bacillota bacterium]|jgi:hypothetical protein
MLSKLKQLLLSGGSKGAKPSNLCLWRDLDGLDQLAKNLAAEANQVADWASLKRQLAAK